MTTTDLRFRASILLAAGLSSSGCRSDASDDTSSAADDGQISSLETQLTDARGGWNEARDQARTCFDEFRSCQTAATGSASCEDALRACLPGSAPGRFDCAQGSDAGRGAPLLPPVPPSRLGLWAPWGGAMSSGHFGFDLADAGPGPADCGGPLGARGPFSACKASIDADMAPALDPRAIGQGFQACLGDVFGDVIDDVCARIDAACSGANPPPRLCDRLAAQCSDAAQNP